MIPMIERRYGVWLYGDRIGALNQKGDYTWFVFSQDYLNDPDRSVLGLIFEEDPYAQHASAMRLPAWFSNLLPEGLLRDWVARDRGVSSEREMELLAQVGRDLPGAVRVLAEEEPPVDLAELPESALAGRDTNLPTEDAAKLRFSLAGTALKFSMLKDEDRLTLPAYGQGGDWIVKLPDPTYADVPRNEFAMMLLAREAGLDVPECILVTEGQIKNLPSGVWKSEEQYAYAVKRFDRDEHRQLVHIEDFAQVRNVYSGSRYNGNFETVGALAYRGHDTSSFHEFARRIAFNVLIANGDAHLKNWSLIYRDRRVPTLSPVYDLVSTAPYEIDGEEDLGLRFHGTRRFDRVHLGSFQRAARKVGLSTTDVVDCVVDTVERTAEGWPKVADVLAGNSRLQEAISDNIRLRSRQLLNMDV